MERKPLKYFLFLLFTNFTIFSATWSETIPTDRSREIIVKGDVLGSRSVLSPSAGFELLVRFNEELFYCLVTLEKTFSGDNMTKVNGCWDETNNL